MAADVIISEVETNGTTVTVHLTTDVSESSQCELHWQSIADSDAEIPPDRVDFSVAAGITQRSFPIDLNIPSGRSATVQFTANVLGPETATDFQQVKITNSGGGGGGGIGDTGISIEMAAAGLVAVALAVYVLSGNDN